jgi:hypothetical protein
VSRRHRLTLVTDLTQRLHKQDFIELTEKARENKPRSHKPRSSQGRKATGPIEGPEDSELVNPIEVD